jgi:ATP-dependent RNA helicase DDX51/DBP6
MSGVFFQRYVPPKSATKEKLKIANSAPITPRKQPTEAPKDVKQKKKSKRRSSVEQASAVVESIKVGELHQSVDESVETPKSIKKPKKRKRETQEDAQAEVEEATPKKHKAVLSKFERSSKHAEAVRSAAKAEPHEEQQEEKPVEELHG